SGCRSTASSTTASDCWSSNASRTPKRNSTDTCARAPRLRGIETMENLTAACHAAGTARVAALARAALAAAVAVALGATTGDVAQSKSAQKTAWGEPDISGQFSEFTVAPLERPAELGEKEY